MTLKIVMATLATTLVSQASFADQARFLVTDQDAIQSRVDIIQQAKKEILVEYFSVWNDDQSVGGMSLLMEAAHRGVKVKIMVDAVSSKVPEPLVAALEERGKGSDGTKNLEFRLYNPFVLNPTKMSHRDHSKMIIIDGEILLTGGRNVGDKYFGINLKRNFTDLDILVKGRVADSARTNYLKVWTSALVQDPGMNSIFRRQLDPAVCVSEESYENCMIRQAYAASQVKEQEARLDKYLTEISTRENDDIVIANTGRDWLKDAPEISDVYFMSHKPDELVNKDRAYLSQELLASLLQAKSDVNIVSPYLIPTSDTIAAFQQLLGRGVRIRIITNSMKSTDNMLAQAGYKYRKQELVKLGIEIYEYSGPDTIHVKTAVLDHKRLFIGTANMDPRSANINREVGVSISGENSAGLITELESVIEGFRAKSYLVAKDGLEYNKEWQQEGISVAKRRVLNALMIAMPAIINQL